MSTLQIDQIQNAIVQERTVASMQAPQHATQDSQAADLLCYIWGCNDRLPSLVREFVLRDALAVPLLR